MAKVGAIWVVVHAAGRSFSGRLVPGRADTPTLLFDEAKAPAELPLGTEVEVGMATLGMANAVRDRGVLTGVQRLRDGNVQVTLMVDHPQTLQDELPQAVRDTTERREWVRVGPKDRTVEVPVRLPDGMRLIARLRDSSAGGLGLGFPIGAEPKLCATRTFVASVVWPGFEGRRDWTCEVRNRALRDGEVRYGVQFKTETGSVGAPGPRFEPLWDCPSCQTEALLAETHQHCPICGHARGDERTRLPEWEDLFTADNHPLCGTAGACRACGVAHGRRAIFCGHCGVKL